MKKVAGVVGALLTVLLLVVGVGAGALVFMATNQPDEVHLERSVVVTAAAADMDGFARDLKGQNAWSPWVDKDPEMTTTYSDTTAGEGATYEWKGNDDVGHGKMTIQSVEEGKVVTGLEFFTPFEAQASATIAYAAEGDDLKVTWSYDGTADMMMKVLTVVGVVDLEAMIGPDYEAGLAKLKPLVEKAAADRMAEEAATAALKEAAEKECDKGDDACETAKAEAVAKLGGEADGSE